MGSFCIGGVTVRMDGAPEVVAALEHAWSPFLEAFPLPLGEGQGEGPTWHLHIHATSHAAKEPSRQTTLPTLVPHADGGWTVDGGDFRARVRPDGQVEVHGPHALYPADFVTRVLIAHTVVQSGGLLVHGVALSSPRPGGGAGLFTGESGAGKSTLGRCGVEGGLLRLADELVVVRPAKERGSYIAHGSPWNVGTPHSAPLRLCGVLAHAKHDALEDVPPSDVLRVLISNVLVPEDAAAARAQVLKNATAILGAMPRTARLHFAPSAEVVKVLQPLLHPNGGTP